jgi:hypothetical protein
VALSAATAAILAGVAVAYFLARGEVNNNRVTGGTLVAATFDPLTFGDERLFPTDDDRGGQAAVEDSFELENTNPVRVSFDLVVRCDREEFPTGHAACDEPGNQFDNLMIEISDPPAPPGLLPGIPPRPAPTVHYSGPLSGLIAGEFRVVLEAGAARTFDVRMWLRNINEEQPQNVTTVWTFLVEARTPPAA